MSTDDCLRKAKLDGAYYVLPPTWDGAMLAQIALAVPDDWTHAAGRLDVRSPRETSPHAPGIGYVVHDDGIEIVQAMNVPSRAHLTCVLLGRLRASYVCIPDVGPARFRLAKDLATWLYRDDYRGRMIFLDRRALASGGRRYRAAVEIDGHAVSLCDPPTVILYARDDASLEVVTPVLSALRDAGATQTTRYPS